jgi:Prophage CP4-57 regulatory protein (AlpA)
MGPTAKMPIKRTIRRQQLREIVPLADSTIYEMEQRGEFPKRFAQFRSRAPNTPTSSSVTPAPSKHRIGLKDWHRSRDKRRHVLSTVYPGLNNV